MQRALHLGWSHAAMVCPRNMGEGLERTCHVMKEGSRSSVNLVLALFRRTRPCSTSTAECAALSRFFRLRYEAPREPEAAVEKLSGQYAHNTIKTLCVLDGVVPGFRGGRGRPCMVAWASARVG